MLLSEQPLWNHITVRGTASVRNSPFKTDCSGWSERRRETPRRERDVTCIASLQQLSGFTVRLIQPITSFPLSCATAAKALIVYPSEKVILTCQVQHRKWLCRRSSIWLWWAWLPAVGWGSYRGISEVDQWGSDRALLRTVSVSAMQNTADLRRKSIWQRAVVVVFSCKNRGFVQSYAA